MSEFWFKILYAIAWFFFNLVHPGRAMGRKDHPYLMAK